MAAQQQPRGTVSNVKDGGPAFPSGERWTVTDAAGCVFHYGESEQA